MEYRILAKGTFSVAVSGDHDSEDEVDLNEAWGDYA